MDKETFVKASEFKDFSEKTDKDLKEIRDEIKDESKQRTEQFGHLDKSLGILTKSVDSVVESQTRLNANIDKLNESNIKQVEAIVDFKHKVLKNEETLQETKTELERFKHDIEERRRDTFGYVRWFFGLIIGGSGVIPLILKLFEN